MDVPVAGLPVQEKILTMRLVLRQVKTPDVPVVFNQEIDGRITGGAGSDGKKVPQFALVLPAAWLGELQLEEKLVPPRGRTVLKPNAEAQAQVVGTRPVRGNEFHRIDRELLPGLRSRDVLVAKRIKAVIRAYKEIMAGDMRGVVKRRLMAYYGLCKGIPDQLNGMVQRPPGRERPPVNIELHILARSPGEITLTLLLVVAAPVHVIKGQVSHGAPTISDQHRWNEARHSLSVSVSQIYEKDR